MKNHAFFFDSNNLPFDLMRTMIKIWFTIILCLTCQGVLFAQEAEIPPINDCDHIMIFDGVWILTFNEDGSVHAQYGSGGTDNGTLPEGSVDFKSFYSETVKALASSQEGRSVQAAFHRRNSTTTIAIKMKDNLHIRRILGGFESAWSAFDMERFKELRKKFPFFQSGGFNNP